MTRTAAASLAPDIGDAPTYERRSDARTLAVVGLHFGVVFAPLYVTAALGIGWWVVPCWLWFGLLSQGALLALHEAAHKLLLANVRANELLASWVLAPLFFADFAAFRRRHWDHHRQLGLAGDPKYTYRIDVAGPRFPRLVVSCLVLAQALRRVDYQSGAQSGSTARSARQAIVAVALGQAVLFASLLAVAWATHPGDVRGMLLATATAYLFVYVYGLASLGVLMHALRGIIEHRRGNPAEPHVNEAALRNFDDGFVERWVFAPYGFVEHATHHRYPGIPYYALPAVTAVRRAGYPDLAGVGSHLTVLRRLVTG